MKINENGNPVVKFGEEEITCDRIKVKKPNTEAASDRVQRLVRCVDVEKQFKADLADLLEKYSHGGNHAELSLDDQGTCWDSYEIIEVSIPAIYTEDGETVREYTEVTLGRSVTSEDLLPNV